MLIFGYVCIFIIQYYAHRAINQLLMIKIENENLLDGYEVDQDRIKDLHCTRGVPIHQRPANYAHG